LAARRYEVMICAGCAYSSSDSEGMMSGDIAA
jgi:hypothetical protein